MQRRNLIKLLLIISLLGLTLSPRQGTQAAQGDENWANQFFAPGMNAAVVALARDSQGNVYAGGYFSLANGVSAPGVARWDGTNWNRLGTGTGGVLALATTTNGLYAGGSFSTAGGITANKIAFWNGAQWSALGSGVNGDVRGLMTDGQGTLYAGGFFTTAGGVTVNKIARWDGTQWSALGSGLDGDVFALAYGNGVLYAAGNMTGHVVAWDGTQWQVVGGGVNSTVNALTYGNGTLYVGGVFNQAGANPIAGLAAWDGQTWTARGSGAFGFIYGLAVDSLGKLYAGGDFTTFGGQAANRIAVWDGQAWSALSSGFDNSANAVLVDGQNNVYAGGWFTSAGGNAYAQRLAYWNGTTWSALGGNGQGVNDYVYALANAGQGKLYAAGKFTQAGAKSAINYLAQWDGTQWQTFGSGADGYVNALAVDGTGKLYAGGEFTSINAVAANYLAQWDGSQWSALGTGLDGVVAALATYGNSVYVGGTFTTAGGVTVSNIARWDGTQWSALGSGVNGKVRALVVDQQGQVYAGGDFTTAGGVTVNYLARWDGQAWYALGSGTQYLVRALALDAQNKLYVGGDFWTAGGITVNKIARWDGTQWSPLGLGVSEHVGALAFDDQGNLYAGGFFDTAGGTAAHNLARWDGASWNALGSGVESIVSALTFDSTGKLYVGGIFLAAGGKPSSYLAQYNQTVQSYTVSGQITTAAGTPLNGATLSFSNGQTATTNTNGDYRLSGLSAGTYTFTPTLTDYTFTPTSRSITVPPGQMSQNFTGASTTQLPGKITGKLTLSALVNATFAVTETAPIDDFIMPQLYRIVYNSSPLAEVTGTLKGQFTFEDVEPGDYRVYFLDPTGRYVNEYYNNASSSNEATTIHVTSGATTDLGTTVIDPPATPLVNISTQSGVTTDPRTGMARIMQAKGSRTAITVRTNFPIVCPSGALAAVTLDQSGSADRYRMSETSVGSGSYEATIPASKVNDGKLSISWRCPDSSSSERREVGEVILYDPSGLITDAWTGQPVQQATVTLYRVPNWLPDTADQTGDCRTVSTRTGTDWSQTPTDTLSLGVAINPDLGLSGTQEISPALNPQLTGDDGRYGWDVVTGCWYVVVTATDYVPLVSAVVGVPPLVTDLNLVLTPTVQRTYLPFMKK